MLRDLHARFDHVRLIRSTLGDYACRGNNYPVAARDVLPPAGYGRTAAEAIRNLWERT